MITFKDVAEIKMNLKPADDFKEKIISTPSSFGRMQQINTESCNMVSDLLGKFFNKPKKEIPYIWKRISKYGGGTFSVELQLSKTGIGTGRSGSRIDVYSQLFYGEGNWNNDKGLVPDVIDDKEVYDKLFNTLTEKGQNVLKALKEAREKTDIKNPTDSIVRVSLKLSKEEKECFGINSPLIGDDAYIQIKDDRRYVLFEVKSDYINENHIKTSYGKNDVLFTINNLNINDERDFQYFLFIYYHLKEFEDALQKYIEMTKVNKAKWEEFKILINEKLAKYIILNKM